METRRKLRKNVKARPSQEPSRPAPEALQNLPTNSPATASHDVMPTNRSSSQQARKTEPILKETANAVAARSTSNKDGYCRHRSLSASGKSNQTKDVGVPPVLKRQSLKGSSQIGDREKLVVWMGLLLFILVLAVIGVERWKMEGCQSKAVEKVEQMEKNAEETVQKQLAVEERLIQVEKALNSILGQPPVMMPQNSFSPDSVGNAFWELVQSRIDEKLSITMSDSTGNADYALSTAGGKIVSHSKLLPSTRVFPNYPVLSNAYSIYFTFCKMLGIPTVHPRANQIILHPNNVPGNCLPLAGATGEVDIKLVSAVTVSSITIEHILRSISYAEQCTSAPKDIEVFGYVKPSRWRAKQEKMIKLAQGTFELGGKNVQEFSAQANINTSHIKFRVLNNHGHPNYTCLYRIRVHGAPMKDKAHPHGAP